MADKIPIRGGFNGGSLTGLAQFASGDTLGVAHGGTGVVTIGSNQLLTGNGTSAITSESNLTFDGSTLATTAFTATGNVSLDGGTFIFNESGADKDFRVEGDTDANLFIADASTDRIGIGTATPSHLVDIEGVGHAATCFVSADLCATTKVVAPALCIGSQYVLPTADGSAGQLMCTDGSGALAFATAASAGISWDGSTANGVATFKDADEATVESNLTFTGTTLTVNIGASNDDNLILSADQGWNPKLTYTEGGAVKAGIEYDGGACKMRIQTGGTTNAIVIDCNQKVGIGTTTPANLLEIYGTGNMARLHGSSGTEASMLFTPATNSAWQLGPGVLDACTFQIYANSPNKSRLTLMEIGGSMGVGDNSAYSGGTALPNGAPPVDSTSATILKVDGGINVDAALQVSGYNDSHGLDIWTDVSIGDVYFDQRGDHDNYDFRFRTRTTGTPINAFTITGAGVISKSSGSFKIDHPLPEKTDTHHLVHSFVEGPQADLLYRGTATLSNGTATVNIDTAARMTDGTFVALNGNVQAFTTNESGFDAVRGSVSGNVLTITSIDDTSTATINWLVVGERHDPHMVSAGTTWTDNDGRVITEPIKEEDPNRMTPARQEAESA
jgi:hypothetical protein